MDTILHDKYSKKINRRIGFFTQFLVNINFSEQLLTFKLLFSTIQQSYQNPFQRKIRLRC